MGLSKKNQVEMCKDSEGKTWVIAGIAIRAPLKPISTKARDDCSSKDEGSCSTTPTARESRIPDKLPCPPAPRKRRQASTCHFNGAREFFNPPELESIFMCHVGRAK